MPISPKPLLFGSLLIFGLLTCARAQSSDQTAAPGKIGIVTAGKIDKVLAERVSAWVAQNIAPVEALGSVKVKSLDSMETARAKAQDAYGTNRLATLVLTWGIAPHGPTHGLVSNRVAVIDVDMLKPADMKAKDAGETFARRVEKDAVAATAYAMGLPACNFILCALKPAETIEEMDTKGRGLCPPCMQKLEDLLAGKR
jgi:hypothetical protein